MNRTYLIMAGIAVVSLAAGGAGGYILAEKRLRAEYDERVRKDVEDAKEFYKKLHKAEEFETPAKAAEKLLPERSEFAAPVDVDDPIMSEAVEALQSYSPETEEVVAPEGTTKVDVMNVFKNAHSADEWNYDEEVLKRTPRRPYVITHQEFLENDLDFEQSTITYYEGDDCLADSADEPINNVDQVVGEDNLMKFGHGSDDPRIVYIQNESLEMQIEVIRSNGKFVEQVLGFIEPKDDRRQRPQKFRRGDDE